MSVCQVSVMTAIIFAASICRADNVVVSNGMQNLSLPEQLAGNINKSLLPRHAMDGDRVLIFRSGLYEIYAYNKQRGGFFDRNDHPPVLKLGEAFWYDRKGVAFTWSEPRDDRPLSTTNVSRPCTNSLGSIAVATLNPISIDSAESETLTEIIRSSVVDSRCFRVLSTSDMQTILKQQSFQRSEVCDDTQCMVEMGRVLSVAYVLGGSVGKIGETYSLVLRLVSVESGELIASSRRAHAGKKDDLVSIVEQMVGGLTQDIGEKWPTTPPPVQ